MCLGIPGKIIKIREDGIAEVEMGGNSGNIREAGLHIVPEAKVGDYVLIHAGFAIQILSEKDAQETLALLRELAESYETT
jgi:hydrogenase expression/formation protein HypC